MQPNPPFNDILLYATPDGLIKVEVLYEGETFWLSQKKMAELFGVDIRTISEHLQNIFQSGELSQGATLRNFRIVQTALILIPSILKGLESGRSVGITKTQA